MENKMCDYLGRGHEFFLSLKKAGFTDEDIQRIINAKDNALAEGIFKAYKELIGHNLFEAIYEIKLPIPEVSESKFLEICREQFHYENWHFNSRLTSVYGESSALRGWYKAIIYYPKEKVDIEKVRLFIKNNGNFPGVFGGAIFWMFEAAKEGFHFAVEEQMASISRPIKDKATTIPKGIKIFSFEEKNPLSPYLVRFNEEKPNWYFGLDDKMAKNFQERALSKNEAFLVFKKIIQEGDAVLKNDDILKFSDLDFL